MIADQAARLGEQLAVRQMKLLSDNQRFHMVKRLDDLQILVGELETAANYLREAPDRHVLDASDRASLERARQAVTEFRAVFSADPVSALEDDRFSKLQRAITAAARTTSNTAQADWEDVAQAERWAELAPMLRALERSSPERSTFFYKVRKLVDVVDALARMAGQQRPSAATRKAFAAKRDEFDPLWADVAGADGVPDGVFAFLGAAHGVEGAPIDALTEPVRSWLAHHEISDRLRIRIR